MALSAARVFPPSSLLPQLDDRIPKDLHYFSPKEHLIFEAVAERIIGPPHPGGASAGDVGAARRADQFLATADPEIQDQFHQLLTVFNAPFFTFLFDLRFSSFLKMSPEDKDSYLGDWMTSNLGFWRTGFQALKRISLSMFYTDSSSWPEIGCYGFAPHSEAGTTVS